MITKEEAIAVVNEGFSRQNVTVNRISLLGMYMDPEGIITYTVVFDTDRYDGFADVYELDGAIYVEVHA